MYDRIVSATGQALNLGTSGGDLLVQPAAPGAMSLTDMQNRTWHLLREDGPDTGFAAQTTGDFVKSVVTRDLNIALGQFISETGIAPALSDRIDTFPVLPVLDHPLPPALVALARVEYTPAGSYTYKLEVLPMEEFDSVTGGILPPTMGQPRYCRVPFAGYIRLQPQPSQGNAVGDTITFYYTSLGTVLVNGGDSPGIPPQFHMAPVYRVLSDYWERKADPGQSDRYMKKYLAMVARAKAYVFDSQRSTQPTIAGDDYQAWMEGIG